MDPQRHDLVLLEHDKERVLEAFRRGEFDAVEVVNEIAERNFFAFLRNQRLLEELAESYPTPRVKEEVPVWFYVAADLALRLHGRHSFHSFPYVVRSGGLLSLLSTEQAQRRVDAEKGDLHIHCEGFNRKNEYPRGTPCDADTLRKMARDTKPDALESWFGEALPRALKKRRMFDPEGIFIGDGSYLFVPDNPAYQNSEVLWFDEHNHPVSVEGLPPEARGGLTRRRCYKMITLLHTNRAREFFLYVGVRMVNARTHESAPLYEMVEEFVRVVGRGVMKLLILDRGFLDGEAIGECRKKHRVEVLIPLRKNMELLADALGLARAPGAQWEEVSIERAQPAALPRRPTAVERRERRRQATLQQKLPPPPPPPRRFVLGLRNLTSWSSCPVPLNVVLNKEVDASGNEHIWGLATTRQWDHPSTITSLYRLRVCIEERHRQLKCFQDLTGFPSRAWSLVVHQVVFTLLAYTLLQWQLKRQDRAALNGKTLPRLREQLLPAAEQIALYHQQYFALLDVYEYQELLLKLEETARQKILQKTQQLRRALYELPGPRRAPP
ncbi:MAG: transposase [Candidatus Methylomirabilis sp.]